MKTSVIEVRDMLSVLSVVGVEELIGKVPGVESVTMNFATGSATVRYDETRLEIADIKSAARQSGYEAADAPAPEAAAPTPAPDKPKSPADAAPTTPAAAAHASDEPHDKSAPAKN